MNHQPLNLRRSIDIVRRYKVLVGVLIAIGVLCGAGYSVLDPPMMTAQTLVIIPIPKPNVATQQTIAGSTPVLSNALTKLGSTMSLEAFVAKVTVSDVTPNVLSISAKDKTASAAENEANDAAASYISYIAGSSSPLGPVFARVLVPATTATGTSVGIQLLMYGGIGVLAGGLIGFLAAVGRSRSDRRLRARDEIADSVGVPVIASIPVDYPVDLAGWEKLFDSYATGPVNSWRLRMIIDRLGLAAPDVRNGDRRSAIVLLSLSSDKKAVAVGPQLAAFASSIGIRTALVIGPQLGMDTAGNLRAAGSARASSGSHRPDQLLVIMADDTNFSWQQPHAALTVITAVIDSDAPLVPGVLRRASIVLSVSAGAVTAEHLALTTEAVTEGGGRIDGIIVVDPEPGDMTGGLGPRMARAARRSAATRLNGEATEIRR